MVQDGASNETFVDPSTTLRSTREFSIPRLIGGKLRALYDDTPQPPPPVVDRLLRLLDDTNPVRH